MIIGFTLLVLLTGRVKAAPVSRFEGGPSAPQAGSSSGSGGTETAGKTSFGAVAVAAATGNKLKTILNKMLPKATEGSTVSNDGRLTMQTAAGGRAASFTGQFLTPSIPKPSLNVAIASAVTGPQSLMPSSPQLAVQTPKSAATDIHSPQVLARLNVLPEEAGAMISPLSASPSPGDAHVALPTKQSGQTAAPG
jgi:hypothetical protein